MLMILAAQIEWSTLALAALFGLVFLSLPAYRRLARDSNLAMAQGDVARSLDQLLRLRDSKLPVAILFGAGDRAKNAPLIALRYLHLGQADKAMTWIQQHGPRARTHQTKAWFHAVEALAHGVLGQREAIESCLARLDDELRKGSVAGLPADPIRIGAYETAGDLARACTEIVSVFSTTKDAVNPSVLSCTMDVLHESGCYDEVFLIADMLLASFQSSPQVELSPVSSMTAQLGLDQLRQLQPRLSKLSCLSIALQAAADCEDWGRYETLLEHIPVQPPPHPKFQLISDLARTVWAAHRRDIDAVKQGVVLMQQVVSSHTRDGELWSIFRSGMCRIFSMLGQHAALLKFLATQSTFVISPLSSSRILAWEANALEALGRPAEATPKHFQANQLAPAAAWNHQGKVAPEIEELRPAIAEQIERIRATQAVGTHAATFSQQVAPVASGAAGAAWALAAPALIPVIGVLPAIALGVLGFVLLFKPLPLRFDVRMGWLALGIASASVLVSATGVTHAVIRHSQRKALMAQFAASSQENDQSTSQDSDDDEATASSEPTSATADEEEEPPAKRLSTAEDRPRIEIPSPQRILLLSVLVISIVLHEIGHAVAAYWCGDSTAKDLGRFSLNPIKHVDPIGSVIVPVILSLLPGGSVLGWAKPVPINPDQFRRKRLGQLGVTLAGISVNLFLAFGAASALLLILVVFHWLNPHAFIGNLTLPFSSPYIWGAKYSAGWSAAVSLCKATIWVNMLLAAFNLLPVPPLDGFGVIRALAPAPLMPLVLKLSSIGMIAVFVLMALRVLDQLIFPGIVSTVLLLEMIRLLGT